MHQWLIDNQLDGVPTFDELSNESSCYLIEEPQEELELQEMLAQLISQYSEKIWRSELAVWDEFGDFSPVLRDSAHFSEWFNVSLSGLTFDLAETNLLVADVEGL